MDAKTTQEIKRLHSEVPLFEEALALCKQPETEGFDMEAGKTWIYPTNYSLREYQFNIIQEALFKNTMVSLPTGLGKTFIAAVIMYNFYRWYPRGKIIFMAPTRPLVKQQIEACYNVMAIPADSTAELTGTKVQASRKEVWNEKRVFFVTPQVLQNDLSILTELGTRIKCLVFDEAHKAKGNHAYCQVIRKLVPLNTYFRVLALSATPGSTLDDVLEVIHNLLISHLEIRTDESPDVTPYIFERTLETVVVPLGGKLQQVRDSYLQILEKYTRPLVQHKIISGNCSTLTKGKIFMTLKDYQAKSQNGRTESYADIVRNLNICITLYHAYELLVRHGLRGFLSFFEDHADKPLLRRNSDIMEIMEDVRNYLGPIPHIEPLPDGTIAEIPTNSKFGHPKFYKLLDILSEHFNNPNNNTSRVIIFCEYRESVMEAYALLLRHRPLIKPRIFLGQGAISQRQQMTVVKSFREGECNTLISTCIGEEGLDVGSVDLIVCFDINNRSPVRLVQRMGRTGRKREGRVVILVTEGKEQQTLKECLIHKQNLTNHILQSSALYRNMYKNNPQMIPHNVNPECQKMFITVKPDINQQKKKNHKIKDMFDHFSSKNLPFELCQMKTRDNRIPSMQVLWNKGNPLAEDFKQEQLDFSKKINKLRVLQQTNEIGHSRSSEAFVYLLQFAESKKYNIPITQVPVVASQSPQKPKHMSVSSFKQADIRNMFAKISSSSSIELTEEKPDAAMEEVNLDKHVLNKLSTEIESYLSLNSEDNICKICDNLFDCSVIKTIREFDISSISEPDISVLESCSINNFEIFRNFMETESTNQKSPVISKESHNNSIKSKTPCNSNIYERTFINPLDMTGLKITPLRQPQNIKNVLNKCGITPNLNDSLFDNLSFTPLEKKNDLVSEKDKLHLSISQSFVDAEFTQVKNKTSAVEEDLKFFNNASLDDIFSEESLQGGSQSTIVYSPTAYLNNIDNNKNAEIIQSEQISPIISSYNKAGLVRNRVNKKLFDNSIEHGGNIASESVVSNSFTKNSKNNDTFLKHSQKSTNILGLSSLNKLEVKEDENCKTIKDIQQNETDKRNESVTLADFADLSTFGLDESFEKKTLNNKLDTIEPIDFPEDPWFDFMIEFSNDVSTFTDKSKLSCENVTKSNLEGLNEKSKVSVYNERIETDRRKEFNSITKNMNDAPLKVKLNPENDSNFSTFLETSPILSNRPSQINKRVTKEFVEHKTPTKLKENIIDLTCLSDSSPVLSYRLSQNDRNVTKSTNVSIKTPPKQDNDVIGLSAISDTSPILTNNCNETSKNMIKKVDDMLINKTPMNNIIDLTVSENISPVLNNRLSQINKATNIKTMSSNFKLSMSKLQKTHTAIQHLINTNNREITSSNSHPKFEEDDNFVFTFNRKKTPVKKPSRSLSTSSSDSPVLNIKTKRNVNCINSTTPKRAAKSNIVISSDSDEDFQKPSSTTSSFRLRPRKNFQNALGKNPTLCSNNKPKRKKSHKEKWMDCEYLEVEAELQLDGHATSDSEEGTDDDQFEKSFVDDDTQNIANTTLMHAQYLKSVRSPVNKGMFKIPQKLPSNINVYSQIVNEGENTYINDSFCVDTEEEMLSQDTITELEVAELVLEAEQKNLKRIRKASDEVSKSKRRRIMPIHSDSD